MAKKVQAAASAPAAEDSRAEQARTAFGKYQGLAVARSTYRAELDRVENEQSDAAQALAFILGNGTHVIAGHVVEVRANALQAVQRAERVL